MKKFLVVIAGPTASGKTAAAVEIAQYFHAEIISADSRQFFRELTIGTAKPTQQQLKQVKHHFISFLSVQENYHAGKFEEEVLQLLNKLFAVHDIVVMTGGSGLYIEAVCNGFDRLPDSDAATREQLSELFKREGIASLRKKLSVLDPEYFSIVDISNPQRLMRAIEVCMLTGKKYSELRQHKKKPRSFEVIKVGLEVERSVLYERINQRVDAMMNAGLLEEAKSVYEFRHANPLQTVGYKELFSFIDRKISLDEAVELIKRNTRRYAKRQLTWFRKDKEMVWFSPENNEKIISYLDGRLKSFRG